MRSLSSMRIFALQFLIFNTMNKLYSSTFVGVIAGFAAPILPYIGLATTLVIIDAISAYRLGRRLRRRGLPVDPRLSSLKLSRVTATVTRIFAGFMLAGVLEKLGLGQYFGYMNPVSAFAGFVCFRQVVSILENESCATDSTWAATARKYLADKTGRHVGDTSQYKDK